MDEAVRNFLAQSSKNSIDHKEKTVYLSKIFKWFEEDFENWRDLKDFKHFVAHYWDLDAKTKSAILKYDIEYTDYSWALNDSQDRK